MRALREHLYSVYIVASNSGVLYTGMTSDLQHRVWQHKNGTFEGFTKKYKCHRLVYFERYDQVQSAIGREKQIKGWTRAKKIELIKASNARWQNLSEHWGWQFVANGQSMKEADEARDRGTRLQIGSSSKSQMKRGQV
jgi:putative endonuclease